MKTSPSQLRREQKALMKESKELKRFLGSNKTLIYSLTLRDAEKFYMDFISKGESAGLIEVTEYDKYEIVFEDGKLKSLDFGEAYHPHDTHYETVHGRYSFLSAVEGNIISVNDTNYYVSIAEGEWKETTLEEQENNPEGVRTLKNFSSYIKQPITETSV